MYRHRQTRCGPGDAATSSPLMRKPPKMQMHAKSCYLLILPFRAVRESLQGQLRHASDRPALGNWPAASPRAHSPVPSPAPPKRRDPVAPLAPNGGCVCTQDGKGFPLRTLGGNRFVKVVPSTMNPWLRRAL